MATSSENDMRESRYADVGRPDDVPSSNSQISIAKVVSTDISARSWRVTLGRVNRADGKAPLATGFGDGQPSLIFEAAGFSYAAGVNNVPQTPPRRSNPIYGVSTPNVNHADVEPLFVQIMWGMGVGSPNRMLANWPLQGASVVVEGSYVEVFAASPVFSFGETPGIVGVEPIGKITPADLPRFPAHIAPADGLASEAAGELSLLFDRPVTPLVTPNGISGGGFNAAGVSTDGIAHPAAGFLVGPPGAVNVSPPQCAIPCSAVYNTAPFTGWNAVVSLDNNPTAKLWFQMSAGGPPQFTLNDNVEPDGGGGVSQSTGDVTITYHTDGVTGVKTVQDLETLIATSAIATLVRSDTANLTKKLFAGFTKLGAYTPVVSALELTGAGAMLGATQGVAVYVPDFAKRLRVELGQLQPAFFGAEYRVPIAGPIAAQIVWYDDQGNVVYTEFQGSTTNRDVQIQEGSVEPNCWRPVPASAAMVAVYTEATTDTNAFFHWRIAP